MSLSQTGGKQSLKGKHVLFADDMEGNQVLGALFLKIAGADVEVVSNGVEAIQKALHGAYDAILIDVHMPLLDGLAATEYLRKEGYKKPIVVVTADCRIGVREKAFDIGANSFLSKPLTLSSVLQVLHQCFGTENPSPQAN